MTSVRSDYVYSRDMARRTPRLPGPMHVAFATHLRDGFDLSRIEPILAALRQGGDMAQHVSPIAAAKKAYEKATLDGQWSRYRRLMDALLNKWGIYHLHAEGSRTLVFTYLHSATRTANHVSGRPRPRRSWPRRGGVGGLWLHSMPGLGRSRRRSGESSVGLTVGDDH